MNLICLMSPISCLLSHVSCLILSLDDLYLMTPPRYVVQLMVDNHEDKLAFLKLICRHVANTRCFNNPFLPKYV